VRDEVDGMKKYRMIFQFYGREGLILGEKQGSTPGMRSGTDYRFSFLPFNIKQFTLNFKILIK